MTTAQTGSDTILARRTVRNKSPTVKPVFDVARFNDVIANTTGSRIVPEIHMAAAQTVIYRISICVTTRNKSPAAATLKMEIQHICINRYLIFVFVIFKVLQESESYHTLCRLVSQTVLWFALHTVRPFGGLDGPLCFSNVLPRFDVSIKLVVTFMVTSTSI